MQKNRKKYIGVFDSGFGGIHILRSIAKELPAYNYLYVGDTARAPYGTRPEETVYEYTKQAVDFMVMHNCELIILACNTASSGALRAIQQKHLPKKYPGKKVLGVLIPAAEEAAAKTKNRKIGVIATEGSVASGAFVREIQKINPKIRVFQNACPLLVPIVEAGEQHSKAVDILLETYLAPLKKNGIDTLILGCTHYGILEHNIKQIAGPHIALVSEARIIPKKLKNYLERHPETEQKLGKNKSCVFYSTDHTKKFASLGSVFFGRQITVKKISL